MSRTDAGLTLVEVLVALTLTVVAMAMFGTALVASIRSSEVSQDIGAVADQARLALARLDRQVRFGYWVKDASLPVSTEAVRILTSNPTTGKLECWFWALDPSQGRLMSYHDVYTGSAVNPPNSFNGKGPNGEGWRMEAGPEGALTDPQAVRLSGTLDAGSNVEGLPIGNFVRVAYSMTLNVALLVTKPDTYPGRDPQALPLDFSMTTRNAWAGASQATAC